jgi:hypothetical protein
MYIKNELTPEQYSLLLSITDKEYQEEMKEKFEDLQFRIWFLTRQANLRGDKGAIAQLGK